MTEAQKAALERLAERGDAEDEAGARRQFVELVCDVLDAFGKESAIVSYSGSGDEGFIEGAEFRPGDDDGGDELAGLREALDSFCEGLLESECDGWEINEGADGSLTIDAATRTARWSHNSYYMSSDDSMEVFGPGAPDESDRVSP